MTRTGLVPRLMQHCDEPFVALHPADAAQYGVTVGVLARVQSAQGWISARVRIDAGMRRGEVFVPMHWNRQFSQQSHVDMLIAGQACSFSGQPALKQTPVRIRPLAVTWQGWFWQREIAPLAGLRYWSRAPYPAVQRYAVAGAGSPQAWLAEQIDLSGCDVQVATGSGADYRLLAWRDGALQLAFYAGSALPSLDSAFVAAAFADAPQDAAGRHSVLAGQAMQRRAAGRIICSCMSVGEQTILQAMAQGCRTTQALGEKLKCGTQCGSCIPELKQLLLSDVVVEE